MADKSITLTEITLDALVNLDRNEHLDLAESLIQQIMETFDVTHTSECEHCGTRKRHNWTDFQAHAHASLIVNRIGKIRGLLESGVSYIHPNEAKEQEDA
jgi:hypothetical protein